MGAITSEYIVEVVDNTGKFVRQEEFKGKYKEARYFIRDNPTNNPYEHYRIIRVDYIEGEEVGYDIVYEEGVSTYAGEEYIGGN